RDLYGFNERSSVGNKVAPFAGHDCVSHVEDAIDRKQPHEEEVPRHTFREAVADVEEIVEPFRKEMEEGEAADSDAIYIVGPVDQHSAPDHQGQHREI